MPRETSPYVRDPYWLDYRRDGKAPGIWQIARNERGSVLYRSTRKRDVGEAIAALDAHVEELRSKQRQLPHEALAAAHLVNYWKEHGRKLVNADQTGRSLRTFLAFLIQDEVGAQAVITDLTPVLFERFREWRMGPHAFSLEWFGETFDYSSQGVAGATVQRNVNDVRAAIYHAQANMRIPMAPKIRDLGEKYKSPPRERVLSFAELGQIAWYAKHNPDLFRFFALQLGTAVRPMAALGFDPRSQFDPRTGLIDLQPTEAKQTKKRNAIVPAIRPLRTVLKAWAREGAKPVDSRKTAWRIMRRTLGLTSDVFPKTIRHTVATMLYADPTVPEREIVELLGHEGKLARTTRIYAKYDPARMQNVTRSLTTIWLQVTREARKFGTDHLLTTTGQGGKNIVVEESL
jgi:integrase